MDGASRRMMSRGVVGIAGVCVPQSQHMSGFCMLARSSSVNSPVSVEILVALCSVGCACAFGLRPSGGTMRRREGCGWWRRRMRRRIGRANAGTQPTALLVWRLWAPARVLLPCPCRGLPLPCRWAWVGPRLDGLRERGVPPHWWGCVPGLHQVWPPSQWGAGYICRVATFAGWLHLPGATG